MQKVIIFKSESDSTENYTNLLNDNNFYAEFIPTIDFQYKNLDAFRLKLDTPSNYSGIIFTSPRTVYGLNNALQRTDGLNTKWFELSNYCVGEQTNKLISDLLRLPVKGNHTGNAESLSNFIKKDIDTTEIDANKPFLFPCGNLKQDILQTNLENYGIHLEPIEIYETIEHPDLERNISEIITVIITDCIGFFVFFSPSGFNYVLNVFSKLNFRLDAVNLIAIGPSTKRAIENKNLSVFSVCEKPTPEFLLKALLNV